MHHLLQTPRKGAAPLFILGQCHSEPPSLPRSAGRGRTGGCVYRLLLPLRALLTHAKSQSLAVGVMPSPSLDETWSWSFNARKAIPSPHFSPFPALSPHTVFILDIFLKSMELSSSLISHLLLQFINDFLGAPEWNCHLIPHEVQLKISESK